MQGNPLRCILAVLLALAGLFIAGTPVPTAAASLAVFVDGDPVPPEWVALRGGRLMVAFEVLARADGASLDVDGRRVHIAGPGYHVEGELDSVHALVNGSAVELEAPFVAADRGIIMPLRFAAALGGWRVHFDPQALRLELESSGRRPWDGGESSSDVDFAESDSGGDESDAEEPDGDDGDVPSGASAEATAGEAVRATSAAEVDFASRRAALEEKRRRLAARLTEPVVTVAGPIPGPAVAPSPAAVESDGDASLVEPEEADGEREERAVGAPAPSADSAPAPRIPREETAPGQPPDAATGEGDAETPLTPLADPVPVSESVAMAPESSDETPPLWTAAAPVAATAESAPVTVTADSAPEGGTFGPLSSSGVPGQLPGRAVRGVTVDDTGGRVRIRLAADGPLEFTSHLLADPSRLVIDVADSRWVGDPLRSVHPGPVVRRIRAGQHQPDTVRVVVDLEAPVRFEAASHPEGLDLLLYQQVGAVTVWQHSTGPVVDVAASGPLQTVVSTLRDPDRLVVDWHGASLVTGAAEGEGPEPAIGRWRISQFQPDTVRLVLELKEPLTIRRARFLPAGPDEPTGTGLPGYGGVFRLTLGPELHGIGLHPTPGGWALVLEGGGPLAANVSRLSDPDRILVDLPGAILPGEPGALPLTVPADVRGVRVARNRPDMVRVVVDASRPMAYRIFRSPEERRLVVLLRPSTLAGRTVVIDPGHGGHDPGAIGVTGLQEAHVNMQLARLLADRLDAEGVRVVTTRTDDVYVPLEERAEVANRVGADLFISIHNNSCPRDCVGTGTETYYLPTRWENEVAAAAMQDELVRAAGLPDRGIKRRNLAVLRHSRVPAVLVEVAFLSSSTEERLLRSEAFLNRAADGMMRGVRRFFAELASDPAPFAPEVDPETAAIVARLLAEGVAGARHALALDPGEGGDGTGDDGLGEEPGRDPARAGHGGAETDGEAS